MTAGIVSVGGLAISMTLIIVGTTGPSMNGLGSIAVGFGIAVAYTAGTIVGRISA